MAEKSTIARPYAEAVFQLADAKGQLKEWSAILQTIALIATDADMRGIIGNTSVNKAQLAQLIIDIAGNVMTDSGHNLVKLLAENRRLDVVAEITAQFEALKAEAEKTVEAEMVSQYQTAINDHRKTQGTTGARSVPQVYCGRIPNGRCHYQGGRHGD